MVKMSLCNEIIRILTDDLGPATQVLLARQCRSRLKKDPADITQGDLDELASALHETTAPLVGADTADKIRMRIMKLRGA